MGRSGFFQSWHCWYWGPNNSLLWLLSTHYGECCKIQIKIQTRSTCRSWKTQTTENVSKWILPRSLETKLSLVEKLDPAGNGAGLEQGLDCRWGGHNRDSKESVRPMWVEGWCTQEGKATLHWLNEKRRVHTFISCRHQSRHQQITPNGTWLAQKAKPSMHSKIMLGQGSLPSTSFSQGPHTVLGPTKVRDNTKWPRKYSQTTKFNNLKMLLKSQNRTKWKKGTSPKCSFPE